MTATAVPQDWTTGEPTILVVSCVRCHNRWYLPHRHCPVCGSSETAVAPARGGGLCVGVTRLHVTAEPESDTLLLALVELDEGPVVMGRVHDDALAPGDRARVAFPRLGVDQRLVPSFAREKADA